MRSAFNVEGPAFHNSKKIKTARHFFTSSPLNNGVCSCLEMFCFTSSSRSSSSEWTFRTNRVTELSNKLPENIITHTNQRSFERPSSSLVAITIFSNLIFSGSLACWFAARSQCFSFTDIIKLNSASSMIRLCYLKRWTYIHIFNDIICAVGLGVPRLCFFRF